jgi:hypothetical protein
VNIVGYVFLGLIALAVFMGLVFAAASLSDIARYLRIRRM